MYGEYLSADKTHLAMNPLNDSTSIVGNTFGKNYPFLFLK